MQPLIFQKALISGTPSTPSEVSIAYIHGKPVAERRGFILLLHGYPETSHQYRHVVEPLQHAGFEVIAPDYRGAGGSSKPQSGYEKTQLAADIRSLLVDHLSVHERVHVVGHDIGGMVAYVYASRYPDATASVIIGECPIPGTIAYDHAVKENADKGLWHFIFHWQKELPEALTVGRERLYIQDFYRRLSFNSTAFDSESVDYYDAMFSTPGAMRAGFELYRAFHEDARSNKMWLEQHGKCRVPCLSLNGKESFQAPTADAQCFELFERPEAELVPNSGHYIAEENPQGFSEKLIEWIKRH